MLYSLSVPIYKPIHHHLQLRKHATGFLDEACDHTIAGIVYAITAPEFPAFERVQMVSVMIYDIVRYRPMMQARIVAHPAQKVCCDLKFVHMPSILRLEEQARQQAVLGRPSAVLSPAARYEQPQVRVC